VPEFRAVVTDLDGTIVTDGAVSPGLVRAVAELRERGVAFVVATARAPVGVVAVPALLAHLNVAVCCGGAVGWSPTGELLWREAIAASTAGLAIAYALENLPGCGIAGFDGQRWMMTPAYASQRRRYSATDRFEVVAAEEIGAGDVCALAVSHPQLASTEMADVLAAPGFDIEVTYAVANLVDLGPPGVDKATGVRRALSTLDIEPAEAIAFGDMPNDLPMLALCGHSVAMANAHPDLLVGATTIAPCVHDDGVARVLADLGLVSSPTRQALTACRACPAGHSAQALALFRRRFTTDQVDYHTP
jgi:Cof subfamily protein (haloacid dehalogenase superfamily)